MRVKIPWEKVKTRGFELFQRYKFVLLVLCLGLILLLWPSGREEAKELPTEPVLEDFSVTALEEKLSTALSKIQGAGDVTVLLTVQGGSRKVLAEDEHLQRDADGSSSSQFSTVVVSGGAGTGESPVLVQQLYPKFQGALVVCSGGNDAAVRLKLMEAVSALTGLGADKISICKGKG